MWRAKGRDESINESPSLSQTILHPQDLQQFSKVFKTLTELETGLYKNVTSRHTELNWRLFSMVMCTENFQRGE